uniref:BTB domain-containing protein n=1 Tax=Arcella intermedia TaxID=1963864 RepID=A0A6B2LBT1_9EUKA
MNIGGEKFYTTKETLCHLGSNFFSCLFEEKSVPVIKDEEGFIFIDRDGTLFRPLLNYLRTGTLVVNPENLQSIIVEAEFYSIDLVLAFMGNLKEGLYLEDIYTNFLCIQRHPERPWCFGVSGILNDKPLLTELFFYYDGILTNTTNELQIVLNQPDKIILRTPKTFQKDLSLVFNVPLDSRDWARAPVGVLFQYGEIDKIINIFFERLTEDSMILKVFVSSRGKKISIMPSMAINFLCKSVALVRDDAKQQQWHVMVLKKHCIGVYGWPKNQYCQFMKTELLA